MHFPSHILVFRHATACQRGRYSNNTQERPGFDTTWTPSTREKKLIFEHPFPHSAEALWTATLKNKGMKGITLLTAFMLVKVVLHSIGVCPLVSGGLSVSAPAEWKLQEFGHQGTAVHGRMLQPLR